MFLAATDSSFSSTPTVHIFNLNKEDDFKSISLFFDFMVFLFQMMTLHGCTFPEAIAKTQISMKPHGAC